MRKALLVVGLVLFAAACTDDGSSTDAGSSTGATPAVGGESPTVLAGDYASGRFVLRFVDDQWSQLEEVAPGEFETGTQGTYEIDGERLLLTEVGGAGAGNVFTFRFSLESSTLSLRFEDPGSVDDVARMIFEHDWERVG